MHNSSCCEKKDKDASCCNGKENDAACCRKEKISGNMVVDVVCGMEIDPTQTKLHVEQKGKVYYFCSMVCMNHFVNDSQKYAS